MPFAPVRVMRGAYFASGYSDASLNAQAHSIAGLYTSLPHSISLWNDHVDSVFVGLGLAGFKSRENASLLT